MFWAEIENLTGWLVKVIDKNQSIVWVGLIIKRWGDKYLGYSSLAGYDPNNDAFINNAIEDVISMYEKREYIAQINLPGFQIIPIRYVGLSNTQKLSWKELRDDEKFRKFYLFLDKNTPFTYFMEDMINMLHHTFKDEISFDEAKYIFVNWFKEQNSKTAAPESYTTISDVDQQEFKDLNFWSQEEKNLPFPKDEFSVGEDTQEYKNKTKVYQDLDEEQGYAYNGVQARLQILSWKEPDKDSLPLSDYTGWLFEYTTKSGYTLFAVIIKQNKYQIQISYGHTEDEAIRNAKSNVSKKSFNIHHFYKDLHKYFIPIKQVLNTKLSWREPLENLIGWLVSTNFDPGEYLNKTKKDQTWYGVILSDSGNTVAAKWGKSIKEAIDNFNKNGYHIIPTSETKVDFVYKYETTPIRQIHIPKPSRLKLSWNELPKAETVEQYDINPLTEINMYPSRRKERQDPVKYRNEKTDSEMIFEKGLHETIERPETGRDLIPYAKLSWKLRGTDNLIDMKEGEIWKGHYPPYDDIMYILPTSQLKIIYDETSYPHISFYGFDGFSIEELEYQFQNRPPYYHQFGGHSLKTTVDKKLPEFERIGDYRDVFSFLKNNKLSWQEPENFEGWLVKKRRSVGTPLYGVVVKDEYDQEDDLQVLYARWSDEEWPVAEEQALSKFNHYGWESLSLKNYPVTKDEDISLIKFIGLPKQASQNQNSLFMYIKPDENLPLKIKEAHTTVVYLNNSIKEEDRENVIKDISNLLKDYKVPECSFGGVATFDNEDKSRVILINFENGAKLYSDLIHTLSKYVEINKNYDFIPHMTIDKDLEIEELPEYKWKPSVLYIESAKDIPAITIEFETGKVGESQNLDETINEDVKKLSWKKLPIEERFLDYSDMLKNWENKLRGICTEVDNYLTWTVKLGQSTPFNLDNFFKYIRENNISKEDEDKIYTIVFENRRPKSVRKLSWQEFTKRLLDSKEGDIWERIPHDPFNREDFLIIYKVEDDPLSSKYEKSLGKSVIITTAIGDTLEEALEFYKKSSGNQYYMYEGDAENYQYIGNIKDFL